jgi:hypothetical protein
MSRRPGWLWARAGLAVAARPDLWATAVRQVLRLAPSGWWRRWPPVPRPDPDYLRFRLETFSGDAERPPEPAAVVSYLTWCRRWRRSVRGRR